MQERDAFVRHFREVQPKFARLCLRGLSHSGLTMPQYALLNSLAAGPMPMKDLSERMHISKPAITNLVDRLESHGFLRRVENKKDRRVTMIEIRSKGQKLVSEMQSTVLGFLLRTLGEFSSAERQTITQFYEKLSKNFDQNLKRGLSPFKKLTKRNLSTAALILFFSLTQLFSSAAFGATLSAKQASVSESSHSMAPQKINFKNFMRQALMRSEVVRASHEDIAIARAQALQAIGHAIGDGDFVVTHNFQEKQEASDASSGVGSTLNASHRRERKFTFSQPLFQGFKSVGAILGAGSLTDQKKEEWEISKEKLFIEVAQAFYTLATAEKNLEIMNEIRKLFEDRVQELVDREKIGRSRNSEVATARYKTKVLDAQIASARAALLSAQSLAAFYVEIPHVKIEDENIELLKETFDLDPKNYSKTVLIRADLEAARQAVRTAKQAIVVAQSAIWPQISLDVNHYEKRQGFQDGIRWDALIKMDVPLYRGGNNIGKLLEAKSDYRQARLHYDLIRKKALLEIEQTHQNWIAAREQHRAYQEAVKAAQENFEYHKKDYDHHLVSNLDVLSALEELLLIREDANQIFYKMKMNYWQLQIATNRRVPAWVE